MPVYDDLHARRLVDGFVLSQTETHDPRHGWLKDQKIPFVSFGRVWKETTQPGPWVDVDGAAGIRAWRSGTCTRPAAGGSPSSAGRSRPAWPRTASAAGAAECKELGLPTAGWPCGAARTASTRARAPPRSLLDSDQPPDGIVALSDILALGALRELSRRGLTPGRDVGVTGFDDSPLADVVSPGLTSLRQPMDRIAAELIDDPRPTRRDLPTAYRPNACCNPNW